MSDIQFILQLDQIGPQGNAARMWLDASRDDLLQPGEEVTLGTIDSKIWLGTRSVASSTGMQFLVKFIAPVGTRWSFVARSNGVVLYERKDQVTVAAKEFLAARLQ